MDFCLSLFVSPAVPRTGDSEIHSTSCVSCKKKRPWKEHGNKWEGGTCWLFLCPDTRPAAVSQYQCADGPQSELHTHHSACHGPHSLPSSAACAQSCRFFLLSLLSVVTTGIPHFPSSPTSPSTSFANKGGVVTFWKPGSAWSEGWWENCSRGASTLPTWSIYSTLFWQQPTSERPQKA